MTALEDLDRGAVIGIVATVTATAVVIVVIVVIATGVTETAAGIAINRADVSGLGRWSLLGPRGFAPPLESDKKATPSETFPFLCGVLWCGCCHSVVVRLSL